MRCNQLFVMVLATAVLPSFARQTTSLPSQANPPITQPDASTARDPVLHVGSDVKKPVMFYQAEPHFTDEARRARFSGTVLISLIVEKDGTPSHVQVIKGVGMGLDEKAVESVLQSKFKPGTLMGKPVRVGIHVAVNYDILK
jgi:TonB family protein